MAAARRAQQAERGRRDQRRVLRRAHLRRRRQRGCRRTPRARSSSGPSGPHVMFEGYWGRPEATVETSRNWWYHTGDIGRIDDDRYLYFVDRKADYLRRRGENISSFEVERILMGHGALADVAVHAVPSELTEDDLKVTATLAEGAIAHRGGAVPLVHRPAALLRPAALHRVPRRAAPQPGRPGAQARAARRGRHRRPPGTSRRPASPTRSGRGRSTAVPSLASSLRAGSPMWRSSVELPARSARRTTRSEPALVSAEAAAEVVEAFGELGLGHRPALGVELEGDGLVRGGQLPGWRRAWPWPGP